MYKTLKIHELTNLNDLKVLIIEIKKMSEKNKEISKQRIKKKTKFSNDKITEGLNLLTMFDLTKYYRNSTVQITKYGKKIIDLFDEKSVKLDEREKILLSSLYRKIPSLIKTFDSYIVRKSKKITDFDIRYILKYNDIKKTKWIIRHLKILSMVNYTSFDNAVFTETGRSLFNIFLLERSIIKFGRDDFKKKIGITNKLESEITEFIKHKFQLLDLSYPETMSLSYLLKSQILTGGVDLLDHKDVINFREFVKDNYEPNYRSRIALLLPCAKGKPFSSSRTHKRVNKALNGILNGNSNLKNVEKVEEFIISEPLGVIPRKFEMIYPAASYDMTLDAWVPLDTINQNQELNDSSKFFSSIQKNKEVSHKINKQKKIVINKISEEIYTFLEDYSHHFDYIVAYVRSTHRDMVKIAAKKANVDVIFVPDEKDMNTLKGYYGPVSWSLRGMRNTETLNILLEKLNRLKC